MKMYYRTLMHVNGIVGCVGIAGGFYYQTPVLVALGLVNFLCAYTCHLNLKLFSKKG